MLYFIFNFQNYKISLLVYGNSFLNFLMLPIKIFIRICFIGTTDLFVPKLKINMTEYAVNVYYKKEDLSRAERHKFFSLTHRVGLIVTHLI